MALIVCPECGREISDRATACPHCAFPVRSPEPTLGPFQVEKGRPPHTKRTFLVTFAISLLVLLIPVLLVSYIVDGFFAEAAIRSSADRIAAEHGYFDPGARNAVADTLRQAQAEGAGTGSTVFTTSVARMTFSLLWLGGSALIAVIRVRIIGIKK